MKEDEASVKTSDMGGLASRKVTVQVSVKNYMVNC